MRMMKPITFGCDNGFKEFFFDTDNPSDESKHATGNSFCYLGRLTEEEKKDESCIDRCKSMKTGQCWKQS